MPADRTARSIRARTQRLPPAWQHRRQRPRQVASFDASPADRAASSIRPTRRAPSTKVRISTLCDLTPQSAATMLAASLCSSAMSICASDRAMQLRADVRAASSRVRRLFLTAGLTRQSKPPAARSRPMSPRTRTTRTARTRSRSAARSRAHDQYRLFRAFCRCTRCLVKTSTPV